MTDMSAWPAGKAPEHKPIAQPEDSRYWYQQYLTCSIMLLERHRLWQDQRDRANLLDKDVDELEAENNRLRDDRTAAEKAAEELANENAVLKQKLELSKQDEHDAIQAETALEEQFGGLQRDTARYLNEIASLKQKLEIAQERIAMDAASRRLNVAGREMRRSETDGLSY